MYSNSYSYTTITLADKKYDFVQLVITKLKNPNTVALIDRINKPDLIKAFNSLTKEERASINRQFPGGQLATLYFKLTGQIYFTPIDHIVKKTTNNPVPVNTKPSPDKIKGKVNELPEVTGLRKKLENNEKIFQNINLTLAERLRAFLEYLWDSIMFVLMGGVR